MVKSYLKYLLKAKGIHSAHSPFLYKFFREVLRDQRSYYCFTEIEAIRSGLLQSDEKLRVNDLGAGSKHLHASERIVAAVARRTATPPKLAQLLFRITEYYQCRNILELGCSLGLTSLYFSSANSHAKVVSIEGDESLAALALKNFKKLGRTNIILLEGDFEVMLPTALQHLNSVDLAYLDGNHRRDATLQYFSTILPALHTDSIVVVGDIHWSREMEAAWKQLTEEKQVTLSLDLFYLGILFFKRELSKQHFVIR